MNNLIFERGRVRPNIAHWIYRIAIILLVVGLLYSNPVVSIAVITLSCIWLLEGDLKNKIKQFLKSPMAIAVVAFYFLHALGVLWSTDIEYALKDLRIKLPLLALPIVFSSINWRKVGSLKLFLGFYIAAVFVATLISTVVYTGWVIEVKDVRDISLYISHIRFGLMVAMAIFILLYAVIKKDYVPKIKGGLILLAVWLLTFLFILKSLSGIVAFFVAGYLLLIKYFFTSKSRKIRWGASLALIVLPLLVGGYLMSHVHSFYSIIDSDWTVLDKKSKRGEEYRYEWGNKSKENGRYVKYFIAEKEMSKAWNQRSSLDYFGETTNGGLLNEILQRYLTSKGLRKDWDGVMALTEEDIHAVEIGVANVRYIDGVSFDDRIYEVIWEVDNYLIGLNPEGNSVGMRFEFWKTGFDIFKSAPIIGVGTGDIKRAYAEMYERNNSKLGEKYRLRGHNQYLTIAVQFGIVGSLLLLVVLLGPFLFNRYSRKSLFIAFWAIAVVSMVNEDTIETQMGVTFIAFFYCFLLFYNWESRYRRTSR